MSDAGTTKINITNYRESLGKGVDFTKSYDAPGAVILNVGEGLTDNETQKAMMRLQKLNNGWTVLAKEGEVSRNRAVAHKNAYQAAAAERDASTAFHQVRQSHAGLTSAIANADMAEFQALVDVAKVPVAKAQAVVQFETLAESYMQSVMNLVKTRSDRDTQQTVLEWNGYEVSHLPRADLSKFPMPKFERPELESLKLPTRENAA